MKSLSRFVASNTGFACLLVILSGLLLYGVGFRSDTLPFPYNSTYSDAAISHWPNVLIFQQAVHAGQWPLWSDLLMGGLPFAANPLSKVWYPPQWMALILPAALHLNLLIWAHLVLAGLGMRALGKKLGLQTSPAAIVGLAYAFTPRLFAATGAGHLDILYASAWLPWLLWAIENAFIDQQAGAPKAMVRQIAALSAIASLSFLADIRISFFSFGAAAALAVWRIVQAEPNQRPNAARVFGFSLPLIAGLTAVQWLPLLALAPFLSRGALSPQDAAVFSLQPLQLIGLAFSDRFGFHETITYVGLGVLVLALVGFLKQPKRLLFWGMIAVIAILYALGDQGPLWPVLVKLVPALVWLRVPSRVWIVVTLALVVLAGFGIQALGASGTKVLKGANGLSMRVVTIIGLALFSMGVGIGLTGRQLPLRDGAWIATVLVLLTLGGVLVAKAWLPTSAFPFLIALIIGLDLVWMDISLVQAVPQAIWLDAYAPLAEQLQAAGVTRLYSPDYSLPQQAAAYWHIRQFGGVDPFQSQAFLLAFEQATGTQTQGYTVTLPPYNNGDVSTANRDAAINADTLAHWNVSHVLSGFSLNAPGLALIERIGSLYLYQNMRYKGGITINWDGSNHITARNSGPDAVNVAAWAPGWNLPHETAAIIAGPEQTLDGTYESPGLLAALALTATSILALGAALTRSYVLEFRENRRG